MNDIRKEIQGWIDAQECSGEGVDEKRLNQFIEQFMRHHNSLPLDKFNGLSPEQMHHLMNHPFSDQCVVELNTLSKDQYDRIPLVRQTLYLLSTLGEKELKLTNRGWMPSKIVAETYHRGQPEWVVEEYGAKRYYEYDVMSVWMARVILDLLGWIKTRKGVLSITMKGRKALTNIDASANVLLRFSLLEVGLHTFDGVDDDRIGNEGIAYSVWLLNKYGSEWHNGDFYRNEYQKVVRIDSAYSIYETRVLNRLFYWLGLVEKRLNRQIGPPFEDEYRKTDLISVIFSFKKEAEG